MSKKEKEAKSPGTGRCSSTGARNGVSGEVTEKIWNMILSFDGYSFCKPHSASYAMVSFQSAYLKATIRPSSWRGHKQPGRVLHGGAYVSEAKRLGLAILTPT